MAKILIWDTENTNIHADFGYMLCFGYKWLHEKHPHVISIRDFKQSKNDPTNDRELVRAAYDILSEADMWVTWYGKRYDAPFMRTRLLAHRLPILPDIQHLDGWEVARYRLKLHSNRLASVSAFLGIEEKTPLKPLVWVKATAGHIPSIKYIEAHCRQDVVVLEQAYDILKPYAEKHANIANINGTIGCPKCGKPHLEKAGIYYAQSRSYQRYRCTKCGAWARDTKALRGLDGKVLSWSPK